MPVLQRTELEDSPLADLHAIASELGLEGYRAMRKADLVNLIVAEQGGDDAGEAAAAKAEPAEAEPAEAERPARRTRTRRPRAAAAAEESSDEDDEAADESSAAPEDDGPDEVPAEESLEAPTRRRRRGGRPRRPDDEERDSRGSRRRGPDRDAATEDLEEEDEEDQEQEVLTGILDVLPNGSGFLRLEGGGQSAGDVYVSPAQIRRCELRTGDEVSGPVRPRRRNERHPSLVRVDSVNGRDPEPAEERPQFEELTAIFPSKRLEVPAALKDVALGLGSRVAIAGPAGAGATTLLRELVATVADRHSDLDLQIVLAGVRPEEVAEWRETAGSAPVVGGAFDLSGEAQAQAAELAVERGKRRAERGGHAIVAIDTLESLPPSARRRVFGAARATEEGGSLTVLAVTGDSPEALRWATTRIVLEPVAGGAPSIAQSRSGTLRAERLK